MRRRLENMLVPAFIGVLALATRAMATGASLPPAPGLTRTQPVLLGYLIMFVLVVIVISISVMPSKRSHQD